MDLLFVLYMGMSALLLGKREFFLFFFLYECLGFRQSPSMVN